MGDFARRRHRRERFLSRRIGRTRTYAPSPEYLLGVVGLLGAERLDALANVGRDSPRTIAIGHSSGNPSPAVAQNFGGRDPGEGLAASEREARVPAKP